MHDYSVGNTVCICDEWYLGSAPYLKDKTLIWIPTSMVLRHHMGLPSIFLPSKENISYTRIRSSVYSYLFTIVCQFLPLGCLLSRVHYLKLQNYVPGWKLTRFADTHTLVSRSRSQSVGYRGNWIGPVRQCVWGGGGVVKPTLCTNSWVQDYVVQHRPVQLTVWTYRWSI